MKEDSKQEVDALVATAQQQIDEHKLWLVASLTHLAGDGLKISLKELQLLIDDVAKLRISHVRIEPSTGKATVMYEYPDGLHAFLTSDRCPPDLRIDGHTVEPKPTAERV
jgi:hypothetical protein